MNQPAEPSWTQTRATAARPPAPTPSWPRSGSMSRLLGWMSAGCIGASVLVMITLSAAGPSSAVVYLSGGPPGPPWWLALHLQAGLVTALIWSAVVVGGCGVAAGLA